MRARHNYDAVVYLHLTRSDFYRMNPGLYYDMVQIYLDSIPRRGNEDYD
ncbi:MAG: hypothetical protein IJ418_02605 [Clostridia bacterium]|nr:hypothetical protein [Clostridia bacterium]